MKTHFASLSLALALALPVAAHAEAAPAPKAEMACCCEKMDRKMACCEKHLKDKNGHAESDAHKGHGGH